ncbi:MAG: Altronate dehydratase [Actinoallomurus sp.]|jgi:altronate hydrolase|nr:Altronate dehydratase [Actinoallomurus sp.]
MNPDGSLRALTLRLHESDDVAITLADIAPGLYRGGADAQVRVPAAIPRGHKIAVAAVGQGQPVRKYGQPIGVAGTAIAPGDHVHTHNLEFRAANGDYAIGQNRGKVVRLPPENRATFDGIVRSDGRVGTRNYIAVIPTVNCSVTAARLVADHVTRSGLLNDHPNVDGVVVLGHSTGCGMAVGEGLDILRRTLTGYAMHPNVAGILVLGLGCEVNQIADLTAGWADLPDRPIERMAIQDVGGTVATVTEATRRVASMLPLANQASRRPVPASELIVGLKCGGSDGYSGITANPALGVASDLVVANGGTTILGETPEVYGAEHLLTARATGRQVADDLIGRIRWWENYAVANGITLDSNPSPGNKEGGITTIAEKSLGAVAKAGNSDLAAVYRYAERVTARGLVFMDTPGYDPVSVTGMVAGGATVVCFTTGRGSVFGCKPTPSLKLATNSPTYHRLRDDMDINCGTIVDGEETVEKAGRRIFEHILATASGQRTRSEVLGFGDDEFIPWQMGAVM